MKLKRLILTSAALFLFTSSVLATECSDNIPADATNLASFIQSCQQKIISAQQQQSTLKATLNVLDSKIRLITAQINQTTSQIKILEVEIANLSSVVSDLNSQLDQITKIYVSRVRESYMRRDQSSLMIFLTSQNISDYLSRQKYLSVIKQRDRLILTEMTSAKQNYNAQKESKITKQKQVEELKNSLIRQVQDLSQQKKIKNGLLLATQNDEKKFQELISKAKAELDAINAIIAGKGSETEVGDVKKGDIIAKIIQGPSCNSSGSHTHFIISDKSIVQNPFNYLKSIDFVNNSGGDPFNPTGSWDWPIQSPIQFNQGYGETWAVKNTWVGNIYRFHNGIDIDSNSADIKAIQDGKLYRGSYSGQAGCALKYVRVDHKDSDIDTFYLHVNYY